MANFKYNNSLDRLVSIDLDKGSKIRITKNLKKYNKYKLYDDLISTTRELYNWIKDYGDNHNDLSEHRIPRLRVSFLIYKLCKEYELFYNQNFKAMVINYRVFDMLTNDEINNVDHDNPTVMLESRLACIKYALAKSEVKF